MESMLGARTVTWLVTLLRVRCVGKEIAEGLTIDTREISAMAPRVRMPGLGIARPVEDSRVEKEESTSVLDVS